MSEKLLDFFKNHELTEGFDHHELGEFISLFQLRDYPPGAIICKEGCQNQSFYVLYEGTAEVYKLEEGTQKDFKINEMRQGALFGEMSVLTDEPFSATIKIKEAARVLEISHDKALTHPAYAKLLLNAFKIVISRLKRISNEQARTLSEKMKEKLAKEKLETELRAATDVQMAFLPKEDPDIAGYDISGGCFPARQVGGDFYDYAFLNETNFALSLGDVSGKGMPAALFMVDTRSVLRSYAYSDSTPSPSKIIELSNNRLCEDSKDSMFVTVFLGILDSKTSSIRYCNAGHNPPLLFKKSDNTCNELETTGIVLGIMEDFEFTEATVKIDSGDILVVFSDGLTEAINAKDELFDETRIMELMVKHSDLTSRELKELILHEIELFTSGLEQFDDMTVIVLKKN